MTENKFPKVSIVFPNWNGKKDTLECLESLTRIKYPKTKLEIVISDNGSSDGSIEAIKEKFSEMEKEGWRGLKLIENGKNLGSCIGRTKGVQATEEKSDHVWMLDNDVIVDQYALTNLIAVMRKMNAGVVGAINYNYFNPEEIIFSGCNLRPRLRDNIFSKNENLDSSKIFSVDFLSGCSMLIKRNLYEIIGYYDPDFFCYYNDFDLCARVKNAGYKVFLTNSSKVWHKVSQTTRKIFGFSTYYKNRNKIILLKKNYSKSKFLIYLAYYLSLGLLLTILSMVIKKTWNEIPFVLRGTRDGILKNDTFNFIESFNS